MTESQQKTPPPNPLRPVIFLGLVFLSVAAVVGVSRWRTPKELVDWQTNLLPAQAKAQGQNKPVLLYFTASWCGPCQAMRRYVWSDTQVAAAVADGYIPVRIDIDQQPALAQQFRVQAVPLLIILSPAGDVVRSVNHGMEPGQMIEWLAMDR